MKNQIRHINKLAPYLFLWHCFFAGNELSAQLLWKVSRTASEPPIYLFGTMHISAGDFVEKHPKIEQTIRDCDVLFTEANLQQEGAAELIPKYIFLPGEMKLSDSLAPQEWQALDSILRSLNNVAISAASLDRCRPMYVQILATTLAIQSKDTAKMRGAVQSVDEQVVAIAQANHKGLRYFETVEEQLKFLFEEPSLGLQFRMLRSALNQSRKPDSAVVSPVLLLPYYYHRQNLDSIARMLEIAAGSSSDEQALYESLLYERNKRWIQTLLHFASIGRNSAFVAVGAGHLVGNQGLIALFRAEGFVVEPVKLD